MFGALILLRKGDSQKRRQKLQVEAWFLRYTLRSERIRVDLVKISNIVIEWHA